MTPQDTPPAEPGSGTDSRAAAQPRLESVAEPVANRPADELVVRPFRLVIPPGFGEAAALRELAAAVQDAHALYGRRTDTARRATKRAASLTDDELLREWLHGQALAYSEAALHLQEHVCGRMEAWDQVQAAGTLPPDAIAAYAVRCARTITRPELPLPGFTAGGQMVPGADPDGREPYQRLGRLVEVMRTRRDQYVGLALQFACDALDVLEAALEGEEPHPRYHDRWGMARAFAMAADHLEESLAEGLDAIAAYDEFVAEHGTWLERIVDSSER